MLQDYHAAALLPRSANLDLTVGSLTDSIMPFVLCDTVLQTDHKLAVRPVVEVERLDMLKLVCSWI